MRLTEIERAQSLLAQALGVALHSTSADPSLAEAKGYIRNAIRKLDEAKTRGLRQKATKGQFEQWWGHIQAGTANIAMGTMSAEASQKSLKQLNALITQEEQKLAELEKSANQQTPDDLLTD